MQGRLRQEYLTVAISTRCAYSGDPLHIQVDSQLKYCLQPESVRQNARHFAQPMVFMPQVDWAAFHDPNIIDAY